MQVQVSPADVIDDPLIDNRYIATDLGVCGRTVRNYESEGLLPAADANLRGRKLRRLSNYRKFKAELLAGKFALSRCLPHLRESPCANGEDEK